MQAGKILGKRYRILERVGGGGMAVVYRAEDIFLGRPVAVKVLRSQYGADEDFVRRFRREAQAAASLGHPNVVSIYDVGEEDEMYYIVMELVEGRTLKSRIQESGPLPIEEAVQIALDILAGVGHAHVHKIVHRDIKPHNILLDRAGAVKVADFGIARAVTTDTVTNTGSILGSAHYFSPEMARGRPAGEKSDLYSLGIVMYEMVTGRVPFQGETPISVALKHVQEEVLPPSVLNPEVPVELEDIILRALEKEPEDRYASAEEMVADLQRFREDFRAGRTRKVEADYPTQDLRAVRDRYHSGGRKGTRPVEAEPDEDGRGVRWGLWLSMVLVLLIGGAVVGGYMVAASVFSPPPDVKVPAVRGMTESEARAELEQAGLNASVVGQDFSNQPAGTVTWQEYDAGMTVKKGRTVGLRLSQGPRRIVVPDLTGLTRAEAEDQLNRDGLKAVIHEVFRRDVTAGRVADQDPDAAAEVDEGAIVDVFVSRGPLEVPNLSGQTLEQARQTLAGLGLTVGAVSPVDHSLPKDTVVEQDPRSQTEVAPGTPVNLTVSTGVAPPQVKETTQWIDVPGTSGTVSVRVVLIEGTGAATELHNTDHLVADRFPVVVRFMGPGAKLQVFYDNILAQEIPLE